MLDSGVILENLEIDIVDKLVSYCECMGMDIVNYLEDKYIEYTFFGSKLDINNFDDMQYFEEYLTDGIKYDSLLVD